MWSNACCSPDINGTAQICARFSALVWKCLPAHMVNTAAYQTTNPQALLPRPLRSITFPCWPCWQHRRHACMPQTYKAPEVPAQAHCCRN